MLLLDVTSDPTYHKVVRESRAYQARIRQKWQKIRHIAKIAKYSATALFHHDNEKKSPPVASTRSRCSSLQQQYTLITPRFFRIPLLIYFSDHRAKKAERFGR